MDAREEAGLIDRALAGDRDAFGDLVDAYGRVVYNLALRMVYDPEDARDLSQSVFVNAYRKLSSFDRQNRFFSWIYRITINESLNLLSRRRRHETLDDGLVDERRGPEAQALAAERDGQVQSGLMQLSPDHRTVIVLRHFLELSHHEMSDVLRIPEKTVKSRLHTARTRLGEVLKSMGCEPA